MKRSGPIYKVHFRRKREGKTDYRRRLKLLKSGKPRLVVRIYSKNVQAQISKSSTVGDSTIAMVNSKHLGKFGWKGATSNLPSSYLVGFLCGRKALKSNVNESILDIGAQEPVKGAKIFAVLKGAIDAGVKIPHDKSVLPDDGRLSGDHIAKYAAELKEKDPEAYNKRFSKILKNGLQPEQLKEHFNAVKKNILSEFGG